METKTKKWKVLHSDDEECEAEFFKTKREAMNMICYMSGYGLIKQEGEQ